MRTALFLLLVSAVATFGQGPPVVSFEASPPLDALAIWTFNEGAGGKDWTLSGFDGSFPNGATFGFGDLAGQYDFDVANTQYMAVGSMGSWPASGTVSFWLKTGAFTAKNRNPFATSFLANNEGLRFECASTGGTMLYVMGGNGGAGVSSWALTANFTANEWHHIVAGWTPTRVWGMFDGVEVIDAADSDRPSNLANVVVGNGLRLIVPSRAWDGLITKPEIYTRLLTVDDGVILYEKGRALMP
ncbi:MAG: LamG-like jellyroll fold domain-containing protein [Planctomycetota bacterium]|jgi:hypothetical protein